MATVNQSMRLTGPSTTSGITLDELIVRLRRRDSVDGIMVIGSTARQELTPASDYDLVIVMSELAVPVDMGHTIVDGRDADLQFFTVDELDDMIETERPVNPYISNGRTLLRMGCGRIEKDKSGLLDRARRKVLNGVKLQLLDDHQKYDRWWLTNMFLRITRRLNRSDDPVYIQAVDLHVNGMLDYLMVDYFNFRDLLWKGEKDAVRYWTSYDPEFLRLFMGCLRESDTSRRVALLGTLCALAADPFGPIWEDDHAAMHIRPDEYRIQNISEVSRNALDFWEGLVGRP